jgi:hypothetical protein
VERAPSPSRWEGAAAGARREHAQWRLVRADAGAWPWRAGWRRSALPDFDAVLDTAAARTAAELDGEPARGECRSREATRTAKGGPEAVTPGGRVLALEETVAAATPAKR